MQQRFFTLQMDLETEIWSSMAAASFATCYRFIKNELTVVGKACHVSNVPHNRTGTPLSLPLIKGGGAAVGW